jgi:hypothetical protein
MRGSSGILSRRSFLATAGGALLVAGADPLLAPASAAGPTVIGKMDPLGRFGATLNRAEFENAPRLLKAELVASLVTSHANLHGVLKSAKTRHVLSNLPPVSQQGTPASIGYPGSCSAEAYGYCLGTHTAANGPLGQFDPTPAANRISAAWMFAWLTNQEGDAGCGGSMQLAYPNLLVASGAPSEAQVPYKPDCSYLSARSSSDPNGIDVNLADYNGISRFLIGSVYATPWFQYDLAGTLPSLRNYLMAGHAIAFSGLVPNGYDQPSAAMVNGAYDPQTFIANSGHSQVIVGFDDSLGHTGAFLIQNSFGTDWPHLPGATSLTAGRLWWTYESFFASQWYGAVAYPLLPVPRTSQSTQMVSIGSGDPVASIVEAARAIDRASGNGYLLLQHQFAQPVRLLSVTLKPPGVGPLTQPYNGTISHGYSHITQRGAFPPGTYQVTLHAETIATRSAPARAITYSGTIQVK